MSEKNEMKEMDEDDFCGSHSFFLLLRSEEEKTEGEKNKYSEFLIPFIARCYKIFVSHFVSFLC